MPSAHWNCLRRLMPRNACRVWKNFPTSGSVLFFTPPLRRVGSRAVRPPRLGGNTTRGVFATRSMFRPNPMGLSVVELLDIVDGDKGKCLRLRGADLLDGTPILDIKPYIPYADSVSCCARQFCASSPAYAALCNGAQTQSRKQRRCCCPPICAC
jgi:tRNA (Thr-GGU) A37 N-methylase